MHPMVSVILIRENAEQLTGGGCCGTLDEADPGVQAGDLFGHVRQQQRETGLLHRAIRSFFAEELADKRVAVLTVDPRNQLYLVPKLLWDVVGYRPGWRAGLRTATQWFTLPAVVVNGRVLGTRRRPVDPDAVCHEIGQILGR
jgi:hypothetical protein